ncbi:hypothetical protein M4578_18870 [Salipiger sp. P9]|uniref:hypothetical protein n=1 Tax=Salipiger pentaromativorans TaxID=2943193 RepID=UPI002157FC91|nr:hypothetical protein [Salipiger pentaromativorans]MCR8549895.1 hypothetical protein [Salipiger pentaromativorans]
MSDPVTNVEIEDVLSSIRRLVSEDARPKASPANREKQDKPERLVLTPAQRVPEFGTVEDDSVNDAGSAEPPVLLTSPTAVPAPESPGAEPEPEAAPAVAEAQADPVPEATGAEETVAGPATLGALVKDELARALTSGRIAEPTEDPVYEEDAEDEALGALLGDSDDIWPAMSADMIPATEPVLKAAPRAEPETDTGDGGLARKIAELEALISRSPDSYEADLPGEGGNAAFVHHPPEPMDWDRLIPTDAKPAEEKFVEPVPSGEPAPAAETEPEPAPQPAANVLRGPAWQAESAPRAEIADSAQAEPPARSDDLGAIDEDILRDMVAEIVRQELQGSLGERITRNVRKLVRREIHRMIVSQDLD